MRIVRARMLLKFGTVLLIIAVGGQPMRGQLRKADKDQTTSPLTLDFDRPEFSGMVQPREVVALESTINPQHYFVGPSDVFSVNIWAGPPMNLLLTVTPEGSLIVPTVGEIKVADLTLADAKEFVVERIKTRYRSSNDPTVTLVTPRQIVVSVVGSVLNAGSYVLSASHRANKAIDEANKVRPSQSEGQLDQILRTSSDRNIFIRHKDGSTSRADLLKYRATREDRWNPYLREGDLIVVPQSDSRYVVGIYGEVNLPTRYEYVAGDSIKDLLNIVQGFTPLAMTDSVEFSRLDGSGERMTSMIVDGGAILEGRAPDLAVLPGDRLVVRARVDGRQDYRVIVNGEVKFPGVYPITKSTTRLSEVIAKAGGFDPDAAIENSKLLRSSLGPGQVDMERLESGRAGVAGEDSAYYLLETNLRIQREIVAVDFAQLFLARDSTQNVLLRDGDVIEVPKRANSIYVFGQVVSPGHVLFHPGGDVEYYLQEAGGLTDRARKGDVKVVKARTKQWLSPDETTLQEGDYVWVPKEPEYSFAYYMGIIGQTAAIVGVAISLILLSK